VSSRTPDAPVAGCERLCWAAHLERRRDGESSEHLTSSRSAVDDLTAGTTFGTGGRDGFDDRHNPATSHRSWHS
jgi:hypothetical protein